MTDEEARALGERLVACKGFRWMPGMLHHYRLYDQGSYGPWPSRISPPRNRTAWPDPRDAATRGCVLELVREWWGDDEGPDDTITTNARYSREQKAIVWSTTVGPVDWSARSEIEALVAVLEATPK